MEVLAGGRPLSGRARQVAGRSREELLGLLADFSGADSNGGEADRELSFSDFLVADTAKPSRAVAMTTPPAAVGNGEEETAVAAAAESKQQQQEQEAAAAAARERRQRRRRSDSRGSCGGGGGDGVLLNFYVPGLLTRSTTAPRHGRGAMLAAAGGAAPATATATAGKARIGASQAVGCWTALWGRDRQKPAKPAAGRRETRVPV